MPDLDLPIFEIRDALVDALRDCSRVVLQAPTGSGKSTQVPQILADSGVAGPGQILILQPRRLAARMLAARVAAERNCTLGDEVGYQIRLENRSGPATRILYVTEGILLRRMQGDPHLSGVAAVLFDEFHERHLFGDITLARALDLQESHRPDLRIIVMSATLDSAALTKYLAPCRVLESAGRTFPVEIAYASRNPADTPVWDLAADALAEEFPRTAGHALVFMPGAFEIQRSLQAISRRLGAGVPVLPLHGELPPDQQDAAVAPGSQRRVIVSTNVAETSLTIQGVTLVIDSGLARQARFDPHRGINTLYIERISLASADQRAGRAGRTAPGRCLRLWTEATNRHRLPAELPEIKRMDLAEVVLGLKAAGVTDLATFRWFDPPDPVALARAEILLRDLGAIDADSGELTPVGRRMQSFPVHPRYARMFLAAAAHGCVRAAALLAALTQSRNLLLRADKRTTEAREAAWGEATSDFVLLIRAWDWAKRHGFRTEDCRSVGLHADTARQAGRLFEQFLQIARAERLPLEPPDRDLDPDAIGKCVLAGFADHVACRKSAATHVCDLVHGRRGVLSRDSVATESRLLVAAALNEIEGRAGEADVTLSLATGIEESWLAELFPGDFAHRTTIRFEPTLKRVVARTEKSFRDLVLESRDRDAEPSSEASACLAREVLRGELVLKRWDDETEQWILRVNNLARWRPEFEIPAIVESDRELLVAEVCSGATSYREIKDRPVRSAIRNWLTPAQQDLVEKLAPERIDLPGGRRAKVTYSPDAPPFVAARIQDLYGVTRPLTIAGGNVPLTIQILAPNFRPVQITTDLANFWTESYPKLKAELSRRYPKHEWR